MEKIEKNLAAWIKKEPGKIFSVLVVHDKEADLSDLMLKQYTILMSNILTATLTGEEIVELAKKTSVIAIEPDAEMNIS